MKGKFFTGIYPVLFAAALFATLPGNSAAQLPLQRKTQDSPRLQAVNSVPVLIVAGTPEQIGQRIATELGPQIRGLLRLPRQVFQEDSTLSWDRFVEMGRRLRPNLPTSHRRELSAVAKHCGIEDDILTATNVMMDAYRGISCSSLIIESAKSATGGPIFGRNLDFAGGTQLAESTVILIYRQEGKHSFATVGFAGLSGCLSGMNESGLAIAVHEVLVSGDESRLFNPKGIPYTFAFRRILEECDTIDEAAQLLRSIERTTKLNLSICDKEGAAAIEITPKNVEVRRAEKGVLICTNHFRTPKLSYFALCSRYRTLSKARAMKTLDVNDVYTKMGEAAMGRLTLQTMVFEPKSKRIHVAYGKCPATDLPLKTVDLSGIWK